MAQLIQTLRLLTLTALMVVITGCAQYNVEKQVLDLDKTMRLYATAARWGDWDAVYRLHLPLENPPVPPEYLKNIRVTSYQELAPAQLGVYGTATRTIELGYINEETQKETTLRIEQQWHYDEESKFWGIESPPPFATQ